MSFKPIRRLDKIEAKPLDEINAAEIKKLKSALKFLIKYIKTSPWNRGMVNSPHLDSLIKGLD